MSRDGERVVRQLRDLLALLDVPPTAVQEVKVGSAPPVINILGMRVQTARRVGSQLLAGALRPAVLPGMVLWSDRQNRVGEVMFAATCGMPLDLRALDDPDVHWRATAADLRPARLQEIDRARGAS